MVRNLFKIAAAAMVVGAIHSSEVAAQESRLDQMISPLSNPTNFEDPRSKSDVRFIFLHHAFDEKFVTSGGNVNIYALQARFAVNDRLSIVATKDGFVDLNPDSVVPKDEGFANIAGGVKYAFFKDDTAGQIASAVLRYEFANGDDEVLQGNGDGVVQPSVSFGWALSDNLTLMGDTGLRLPVDNEDSSFWDADLHLDYRVDTSIGAFYPTVEVNMEHVTKAGERLPIPDEGVDFFNLGATKSAGESIFTGGVGVRYRAAKNVDLGVIYQVPLNSGEGSRAVDWRVTADAIVRF